MDKIFKVAFGSPSSILLTLVLLAAIGAVLFTDLFAFV